MIEESLLKSNFLGRDGFRWWIGQIPQASAQGAQINGGGWGNRFKVRIMGYHPYNTVELPDEDLPWAQALIPTTSGSGAANVSTDVKLQAGDTVFGFFLDGDNAQIPVIMGCFGRTSQVPSADWAGPFQAFTGYTDKVKKPNGTLKPDQSNESNSQSQKSPRSVSPQQAEALGNDEISSFSAIGDAIQLANTVSNTTVNRISTEINNLINKIKFPAIFTDIKNEINRVTAKIQAITNGLVGNMVNSLFKDMIPILKGGLDLLYKSVYAITLAATGSIATAREFGVKAQEVMILPMKVLQQTIPCLSGSIISGLGSVVSGLLNSVVDNVDNFVSCAANQFTGVLVNDIIGKITSGLSSALGGIGAILKFIPSFSVDGILRGSSDAIKGLVGLFDCNQSTGKADGIVDQWVIGSGPANVPAPNFDKILENANVTNAISTASDALGGIQGAIGAVTDVAGGVQDVIGGVAGAFSAVNNLPNQIGGCYTGPPLSQSIPMVNIFGGGRSGATAVPLIGAINGTTGSVIGAKVTDGGSGYKFPPFVEIADEYNQGYGTVARTTINDLGEVDSVYIVSEGENYAFEVIENYVVDSILIQNPGQNYSDGDTAKDQFGNEYSIQIFEGSITKARPINTIGINDLPVITIKSNTGSGAILRPLLDVRPEFQGKVKQVIDCVT